MGFLCFSLALQLIVQLALAPPEIACAMDSSHFSVRLPLCTGVKLISVLYFSFQSMTTCTANIVLSTATTGLPPR